MTQDENTDAQTIGVISDTHGLLRPAAVAALAGSRTILHAGDVGKTDILGRLQLLAPLIAIRGNVDTGPTWASLLPATLTVEIGGIRIHLVHDRRDLSLDPAAAGIRVVVSGHSHQPSIEESAGVLYLNPGSAGPRRFHLPITLARLHLHGGRVEAELVELEVERGSKGGKIYRSYMAHIRTV